MNISTQFDAGNIEVIEAEKPSNIRLNIRKDSNADFFQWFHFRVSGVQGERVLCTIENAGQTSYPEGWENYKVCVSYDKETWFRGETSYENGALTFQIQAECDTVYFAYFTPYEYERHEKLIGTAQLALNARHEVIGKTVQGRDLDMLTVGEPGPEKKRIWVIARQHPGESMASWFMEGFLWRLLDSSDSVSRAVLKDAVCYIVPHMNPDGAINGNLRANFAGANLNREWESPTMQKSPEVYYTLKKMQELGMDLCLDIHGDEELPYNFIHGPDGVEGLDDKQRQLEQSFKERWMRACPDFQDTYKYEDTPMGEAHMGVCTAQLAHQFRCLALTIEMPFKDNADWPDEVVGWSAERSMQLGASVMHPVLETLAEL